MTILDTAPDTASVSVEAIFEAVQASTEQKKFGWSGLDDMELGLNPGELAIVAGRTGHGKSTVLLNTLVHWLETYPDQDYIFFSYEIPVDAVIIKLISILSRKYGKVGWSYHEVRRWIRGQLSETDRRLDEAELERALSIVRTHQDRLVVIYEPDLPVLTLAERVERLRRERLVFGGIFVDYLQLVTPPPGRYERREHEVAAIAKELKQIGVNAQCPVIAAAQIGREAAFLSDWIPDGTLEDEKVLKAIAKRRPQIHHLREGGGEQEADLVLGLLNYRADFIAALEEAEIDPSTRLQSGAGGPFDLSVLKNRYGQLAMASLVLESRTGLLRDPGVFGF